MSLKDVLNAKLDRFAHPTVLIGRKAWSSFRICGYAGLLMAVLLTSVLVSCRGYQLWVIAVLVPSAMLTFFALAMVTKIITGEEYLVYYHHQIGIITVASIVLWGLRQPVLPYLDLTILGIGMFLTSGRIGCLMVGCCHGRPHSWGVCYQSERAATGSASYKSGVRFFPLQAVESMWVFSIVITASIFFIGGSPPGEALTLYVVAYGLGRFYIEFARGDLERPYYWGFSEAQWLSVFLMVSVLWAELSGVFPFQGWHIGATGFVLLTMIAAVIRRRSRSTEAHSAKKIERKRLVTGGSNCFVAARQD